MSHKILVLDDEPKIVDLLARFLRKRNLEVSTFSDTEEALRAFDSQRFDVAVVDLKMPVMDGTEWAREALKKQDDLKIIIMTAYGTMQTAVSALRTGVHDYLLKPFDMQDMYRAIEKAVELKDLTRKTIVLERELERVNPHDIHGHSPSIRALVESAQEIAQSQATVKVTGESGVGKEVLARFLHHHSPRAKGPFVAVNCAAIPENLLESELFGTRKGGYTDAVDNPGQFQLAEGGTLFLDEIGELPLSLQPKLLRAVEYLEVKPVGGQATEKVNFRLIVATNRDLGHMVKEGKFRGDLYYRLNVFNLSIPPLRERLEDLEDLIPQLILKISNRVGKAPKPLSEGSLKIFKAYDWPGNIRELENVLERALVLSRGNELEENMFSHLNSQKTEGGNTQISLEEDGISKSVEAFEKKQVEEALRQAKGFKKRAAEILKISQRNLSYYLKKHDIAEPDGGEK